MTKLPGNYVAGFVDGEGCFALNFRRDIRHERKNKPVYFSWKVEFAIMLHGTDRKILEEIKNTLGCGKVGNVDKRGSVRYSVAHTTDLIEKVVPFFHEYCLRAKKKFDFELWEEAVHIIHKNQRKEVNTIKGKDGFQKTIWSPIDLKRLKTIRLEMKKYKGDSYRAKWLTEKPVFV